MKKNLGSVTDFLLHAKPYKWAKARSLLLTFMLIVNTLNASPLCTYYFEVSDKNPFVKEGVFITFFASQNDKSTVVFYELSPPKGADYELHFLKKTQNVHTSLPSQNSQKSSFFLKSVFFYSSVFALKGYFFTVFF